MRNHTQLAKWVNSLAVRIPQDVIRAAGLEGGEQLSLDLAEDGSIVLRPGRRKYSLDELVAGITKTNCHRETDWGLPQGRESW